MEKKENYLIEQLIFNKCGHNFFFIKTKKLGGNNWICVAWKRFLTFFVVLKPGIYDDNIAVNEVEK